MFQSTRKARNTNHQITAQYHSHRLLVNYSNMSSTAPSWIILTDIPSYVMSNMDSDLDKGTQTNIVLLDFSKAFDKVPHQRLLMKLSHCGVRGTTLEWIKDFLSNRTQTVVLEGMSSSPLDVLSGVPQGTVLGPLLFLVYINDLPDCTLSDARLFADDCLVYREIRNIGDASKLQQDLTALEAWEQIWQMSFHPEKCTVIRVTNKRQPMETKYMLHGHQLEVIDSGKYLGITISQDLQWTKHISTTIGKSQRTLGFL